jgi:hypothetical protein
MGQYRSIPVIRSNGYILQVELKLAYTRKCVSVLFIIIQVPDDYYSSTGPRSFKFKCRTVWLLHRKRDSETERTPIKRIFGCHVVHMMG